VRADRPDHRRPRCRPRPSAEFYIVVASWSSWRIHNKRCSTAILRPSLCCADSDTRSLDRCALIGLVRPPEAVHVGLFGSFLIWLALVVFFPVCVDRLRQLPGRSAVCAPSRRGTRSAPNVTGRPPLFGNPVCRSRRRALHEEPGDRRRCCGRVGRLMMVFTYACVRAGYRSATA